MQYVNIQKDSLGGIAMHRLRQTTHNLKDGDCRNVAARTNEPTYSKRKQKKKITDRKPAVSFFVILHESGTHGYCSVDNGRHPHGVLWVIPGVCNLCH